MASIYLDAWFESSRIRNHLHEIPLSFPLLSRRAFTGLVFTHPARRTINVCDFVLLFKYLVSPLQTPSYVLPLYSISVSYEVTETTHNKPAIATLPKFFRSPQKENVDHRKIDHTLFTKTITNLQLVKFFKAHTLKYLSEFRVFH